VASAAAVTAASAVTGRWVRRSPRGSPVSPADREPHSRFSWSGRGAFYGACLGGHLLPVSSGSPSFFRQCDHRVTTGGEESHTLSVPNKKGDRNEKVVSCWLRCGLADHARDGGGHDTLLQNPASGPALQLDRSLHRRRCRRCVGEHPSNGFGTGSTSGAMGGLYAGYNWQFAPQWLLGVDLDMSWTDLSRVNWLTSMRGRIGFTPAWTMLLYFTGGAAWSEIDNSEVSLGTQNQSKSGWVMGAGVEWAPWANNWLVRAEYLNYNFGGVWVGPFGTSDLTINEVRVGF
jgi:opacity protein-like surface antigen